MKLTHKNNKKYTLNSLETYNLTLKLRREKRWGAKRIKKYLEKAGITTTIRSIEGWIYENKEPFLTKIVTQISETSKNLTPDKAYILGVLCGDGYISTGYRIGLSVCDKEFAHYFRCCLEKVYGVKCSTTVRIRKPTNFSIAPKIQYVVSLVSKLVFKDIQNYAESFKSKKWRVPNQIKESSKEIQAAFMMGFADSEAHIRLRKGHGEITIHSCNKKALMELKEMLSNTFKIKSKFNHGKPPMYYLGIFTYDGLKKFHDEIGFVIKRKKKALKQNLALYKRKGIRRYPEEFKLKAVDLLKQGLKHKEIAKLLGTSPANIYDWESALLNKFYRNIYK